MKSRLIAIALISMGISGCSSKSGQTQANVDPQHDPVLKMLDAHVLVIEPKGDKVRFVTDGFGSRPANPLPKECVVGANEPFWSMQDRHAHASLVVTEIKKESVVLTYQSTFDARSFGDGVKSEKRDIELPFRGKH